MIPRNRKPACGQFSLFDRSVECDQSGFIVVFFAIALTALLLVVALYFDIGRLIISKRDRESVANLVSSEALTAYSRASGPISTRVSSAMGDASNLASANLRLQFSNSFLKDQARVDQDYAGQDDGTITPGRWFFTPPPFVNNQCAEAHPSGCPCQAGKWTGPCFQPAVNFQGDPDSINAFYSFLKTKDDNRLQTVFARVGDLKEVAVMSESTLAIRPLRVVFLVDLSRYSDEETHIPYELAGSGRSYQQTVRDFNPAEAAYQLIAPGKVTCDPSEPLEATPVLDDSTNTSGFEGTLTCPVDNIGLANNYSLHRAGSCTVAGGERVAHLFNNGIFNLDPTKGAGFVRQFFKRTRLNDPRHPLTYHARYDYRCLSPDFAIISGGAKKVPHLVDTMRGDVQGQQYRGPEPLESFLAGVRKGLTKFEERKLNQDRVAFIAFDHEANVTSRRVAPVDASNKPIGLNFVRDAAEFIKLEKLLDPISDLNNTADLRTQLEEHALFPRSEASLSIPAALLEAYKYLSQMDGFNTSENMIVLLTTGLTSCYGLAGPADGQAECRSDYDGIDKSLTQVQQFTEQYLAPSQIRLNIIMRSPRVLPHTMLTKSVYGGGCSAADEEASFDRARTKGSFPVKDGGNPNAFDEPFEQTAKFTNGKLEMDSGKYFLLPNRLAEAVRATGGIWGPVRKSCSSVNGKPNKSQACLDDTENALKVACTSAANPPTAPGIY